MRKLIRGLMNKLILMVLSVFAVVTVNADIMDSVEKYTLKYSITDDDKTRTFGDVACTAKGKSDQDYTTNVDDCDADGLCEVKMMLNSKLKYSCNVLANGKKYFLGTFKVEKGAIVIDDRKQDERVVSFELSK